MVLHPKALKKIGEDFDVSKMIYISRKPTSLARDLVELLQKHGYEVARLVVWICFRDGAYRDLVCLLSKLHSEQHIEVELQMDELDLTAAESKATYEEIKDYVLEHTGLKVSSLYIAQVKREMWDYREGELQSAKNRKIPDSRNARQRKKRR